MTTLNINGRKVTVGDEFLRLSPEQQQATVDEIASSMGNTSESTGLPADDTVSKIRTASGGMLEGIPVIGPLIRGGVERAAAATIAPFSDETYDQVLQRIQAGSGEEKAANPRLDTASQIAGGVGGTIPMVMAAPAAFGAGGGGLLANMGLGAASGTVLGSADAGVRSGGDPAAIKEGAATGLVLGSLGPLAGRAVGSVASGLGNWLRGGGASKAEQSFARALGSDAIAEPEQALRALGPDAMPMDLGPNAQRQAAALAATPGEGQQIVRSAISNRQGRAGSRVIQAVNDTLGGPVDTIKLADDLIISRRAAAKPLYDKAYSQPVPFTRELEDVLKRPTVGKALRKAQSLAADEGIPSQQWFATVADDGTVNIKNVPDVRQLDLTQRALSDMASAAARAGNNNEARVLGQLKDQIVGMVDQSVPDFAAARKAYAGPSSVIDAMDAGKQVFKNDLTPGQLRTQLMKMGEGEREAFVQGARAQIAQIMGTARNDALAARTAFQKGFNQEKLSILVGDDQARQLLKSLDAETAFTKTRDVVSGGSETAARIAAQREIAGPEKAPGALRSLMNFRFGDAIADVGDKAIAGAKTAAQERSNAELASLLTSNDPQAATRTLKMVQAAQRRGDITSQQAREIIQSLGPSISGKKPLEITVRGPNGR